MSTNLPIILEQIVSNGESDLNFNFSTDPNISKKQVLTFFDDFNQIIQGHCFTFRKTPISYGDVTESPFKKIKKVLMRKQHDVIIQNFYVPLEILKDDYVPDPVLPFFRVTYERDPIKKNPINLTENFIPHESNNLSKNYNINIECKQVFDIGYVNRGIVNLDYVHNNIVEESDVWVQHIIDLSKNRIRLEYNKN